jgi:hypothetical protein
MRCNLCQLVYGLVNDQGLCNGCAEDISEAERIVQYLKTSPKPNPKPEHARIDAAASGLKDEHISFLPVDYQMATLPQHSRSIARSA